HRGRAARKVLASARGSRSPWLHVRRGHSCEDECCPRDLTLSRGAFMQPYSLSHLLDHDLLADLHAIVRQDRATTAKLFAHLAEVEARRLYLPAAHSSMFWYCVREPHMSESSALKRLRAARAARRYPAHRDCGRPVARGRGGAARAASEVGERKRAAGGSHAQVQAGD